MTRILNFSMMVLVVLNVSSCKQKSVSGTPKAEAKFYPTEVLAQQDVQLQSVFPAVLKGQEDIDIKPRVEGFIEAVFIDEGSMVTKGQPLFKINSPASVQALENTQANYNTALTDLERMRPLAEKGIISEVKLKSYENNLTSAKAALDQAKATIGWTTVTSPISGVVGTVPLRLGSLVNSATILTTVSNTSNVVANFSMNEKELLDFMMIWEGKTQAQKIKNMPPVKLQLANGAIYKDSGRIETISGVVDAVSGAVNIRVVFPNTDGLLRSGTSGKVIIPKTIKNVVVIPQRATMNQQDKVLVYKVDADSVVQKIITVQSTPDGQFYAVTKGLESGDKIVTDGVATLKNGQKIRF